MIRLQTFRREFPPTVRLALPLVLAELGWMSMAIVDTVMVGHLPDSATAMAAVSLGSNIFIVLALFGAGLLMGLDTLVSQAFGAGQREDCTAPSSTAFTSALFSRQYLPRRFGFCLGC